MATLSLEAGTTLRIRPEFRYPADIYVVLDPGEGSDALEPFSAIRWCCSTNRLLVAPGEGYHIGQFNESLEQQWRRGNLNRWLDSSVKDKSITDRDRTLALKWFGIGLSRSARKIEVPSDFILF